MTEIIQVISKKKIQYQLPVRRFYKSSLKKDAKIQKENQSQPELAKIIIIIFLFLKK